MGELRLNDISYSGGSAGGGGSAYTETEIYTNSGTSVGNITLTADFTEFDELYFDVRRTADSRAYHIGKTYKTSQLAVGDSIQIFGYSSDWLSYDLTSATAFTKVNSSGNIYIKKIVGIKY